MKGSFEGFMLIVWCCEGFEKLQVRALVHVQKYESTDLVERGIEDEGIG